VDGLITKSLRLVNRDGEEAEPRKSEVHNP
jgi:hypothetical protein